MEGAVTELLLSDDDLKAYLSHPKRIINPRARWHDKPGHRQRNYSAVSKNDDAVRFRIYLRQNPNDEKDFSCGLALIPKGGKSISLARYNGSSHRHGSISYRCHIHHATAAAIKAGKKPDGHAEETDRYRTLGGALACLIEDCAVQGLTAEPDQPELFQ